MKIINKTTLQTRPLKRLILAALRREMFSTDYLKRVSVRIEPRLRHRGCMGRAPSGYPNAPSLGFRLILRPEDTPREIASTTVHEAAHNHGTQHRSMPRTYRYANGRDAWAWADAYPVPVRPPKIKIAARFRPVDSKLAHAQGRLVQAVTRTKRAKTIEKKWRSKVKYYERRLAAATPAEPKEEAK
jgi:hypothetical protein